jgi:hypothetical protein
VARVPEQVGNAFDASVDDEGATVEPNGDFLHGRRDCDCRANLRSSDFADLPTRRGGRARFPLARANAVGVRQI